MADLRSRLQEGLQGSYTIERELGRGGMATVYLAQDLRHDRPVALKDLLPELASTLGPERFQREIRLAARLQHPHILTVHDCASVHPPRRAGEGARHAGAAAQDSYFLSPGWLRIGPTFDPLRRNPRFQRLVGGTA
jgi:serine/threonine protein kinase